MDEERYADLPIEQLIEHEIDRSLAVDPSPEFLARVRARIASEPMAPSWNYLTMSAAVAAATLAVATVVGVITFDRNPASTPGRPTPIEAEAVAAASTKLAQESSAEPPALHVESHVDSRPSFSRRTPAAPSRVPKEPEVLVAANDAEALRHFASAVREGAIDLTAMLREAPQATIELQPPSEAALRWLTIDPLVQIVTIPAEGAMQ